MTNEKNCMLAKKRFNYGLNGRVLWSWPRIVADAREQLFIRFYHSYKTTERITFDAERQAKSHRFQSRPTKLCLSVSLHPYNVWVRPVRCSFPNSLYWLSSQSISLRRSLRKRFKNSVDLCSWHLKHNCHQLLQ